MDSKPKGYAGGVLRVNLTNRHISKEEVSGHCLKKYIGGAGLAAYILNKDTSPQTDPLGPENCLIFMTGPFTNTMIPCTSKHAVVSLSPLTGIYAESDSGGTWGVTLKRAGYDGLIITGCADEPVYLYINDGHAEIRPAGHIWGKDTYMTDDALKAETSQKAVTCSIGPAGERLVRLAAIMNDGRHGRAAGRCGLGAVMGSKKLKAVVVEGSRKTEIANTEKLRQSLNEAMKRIYNNTEGMRRYGTGGGIKNFELIGSLPIQNWRKGSWEQTEKLSGVNLTGQYLVKNYGCGNCIIKCGKTIAIDSDAYKIPAGAGPEYETIASFGSLLLINNLEAIAKANELCNRIGLDTISTGSAIAFAIEANEKGLLDGYEFHHDLKWGDEPAVLSLIEQIGYGTGLGNLLGLGVREAAVRLGDKAVDFAMHVKGLELPMHDPRALNSLAVGYATSNRGACHLQSLSHTVERAVKMPEFGYDQVLDRFASEGKGVLVARMQNLCAVFDALKLCKFTLFGILKIADVTEWLNNVTGWQLSVEELMLAGERMFNLKRMYNVRLGISRLDDTLPKRILTEPRGDGGAAYNLPPLDAMLDEYYNYRGWGPDGVPLEETLSKLGLTE